METVTIGRYIIDHEIGRGGMGIIYLARDPLMDRQVAIKLLPHHLTLDPTFMERFQREIKVIAALDHPGIVPIYDSGIDDNQPYYVMRYMSGGSLADRVKHQTIDIEATLKILEEIGPALDEAHSRGIIHRDIKPANILFDHRGQSFLSDFGIVKLHPRDNSLTGFNVVGTPTYMSPEVASGMDPIDGRSDIYSLAVLLFRCWTGILPYYSESPMAIAMKHIQDPIPNILEYKPNFPPEAKLFLDKAMAKDALDRFDDVKSLILAMRKMTLQGGQPTPQFSGISHSALPVLPLKNSSPAPNNLPPQTSSFVGRSLELEHVETLLNNPGCRLVCLLGPGGIGKTRLSLEIAARQLQFPWQGVFFVQLAPLSSPDLIVPAIAETIGFNFYSHENPLEQLANFLREKRYLLLLDNYEHLVDMAEVVSKILSTAPEVKIMVTSRERLNLQEEYIYPIEGIEYPQYNDARQPEHFAAYNLFVDRAKKLLPDFAPSDKEKSDIIRICRLVQGIPLGIELAAAWVRILSCQEIGQEIENSLDFLASSLRNVSQRHRSLRAVFEYSWNLLTPQERTIFMKLSVFQGGFNREAANIIAGSSLTNLAALVDKSLVRKSHENWFELLEVIKQFSSEKLQENTAMQVETQNAHCGFYLGLLDKAEKTDSQEKMMAMIENNLDNIRLGWGFAIDHQSWQMLANAMAGLYRYYEIAGWIQEGSEQFGKLAQALSTSQPSSQFSKEWLAMLTGKARARQGAFLYRMGQALPARSLLDACVAQFRVPGLEMELAFALNYLGGANHLSKNFTIAEDLLQESLTIFQSLNHHRGMAISLHHLGLVSREQADLEKARERFSQSLEINKMMADDFGVAISLNNLGSIARELGEHQEAMRLHSESLGIRQILNDHWGIANSLEGLGLVAHQQGDTSEALSLLGKSREIYREIGDKRRLERIEELIAQLSF